MSRIEELKKKAQAAFESTKKEIDDSKKKGFGEKDERFWKPTFDKEKGSGAAIVRFLPPYEDEPANQRVFHNSFEYGGKWFIENNLSTLGKDDPVYALAKKLYDSKLQSNIDIAKLMKRKEKYYANVLVIKDPANPEAEGKVFIYEYGAAIRNLIKEKVDPQPDPEIDGLEEDDDESEKKDLTPVNVWCPWSGADLRIIMSIDPKSGMPTYARSKWKKPAPLAETDEEIDEIWKKTHSLLEFVATDKFKTADKLKERLHTVFGDFAGTVRVDYVAQKEDDHDELSDHLEEVPEKVQTKPKQTAKVTPKKSEEVDEGEPTFNEDEFLSELFGEE